MSHTQSLMFPDTYTHQIAFQSKADHRKQDHGHAFLLLWPWPCSDDLDIRTCLDVLMTYLIVSKMNFLDQGFQKSEHHRQTHRQTDRHTHTQTDATENITTRHSRMIRTSGVSLLEVRSVNFLAGEKAHNRTQYIYTWVSSDRVFFAASRAVDCPCCWHYSVAGRWWVRSQWCESGRV